MTHDVRALARRRFAERPEFRAERLIAMLEVTLTEDRLSDAANRPSERVRAAREMLAAYHETEGAKEVVG